MTTAKLRILETTDLHMALLGQGNPPRGLVHLSSNIKMLRSKNAPCILCDNGDFLQGTPLAEHLMATLGDDIHPAVDAMNALGYDAVTLGNHEFNYGLEKLQLVMRGFQMPVVCANVRRDPTSLLTKPWAMVTREMPCADGKLRTLNIGIIGFVTPQIVDWDHLRLQGQLATDDIVAAALTHTPAMRRAGADLIVALCHSGIGSAQHTDRQENAATVLAGVPAIDVVLTGHTHDQFPGPMFAQTRHIDPVSGTLHGKPTVMAGFRASHLGVITLILDHSDTGWKITGHISELLPADSTPDPVLSACLQAALAAPIAATAAKMAEPLATALQPITSHFTVLGHDPALSLVARAQMATAAPILARGPYCKLPVISVVSSFSAGGRAGAENFINIGEQEITRGDVAAMSPFNNALCLVLRRGWQLRRWLEACAGFYQTVTARTDAQTLINPMFPAYKFDHLIGLDYTFDLSRPALSGSDEPATASTNGRLARFDIDGQPIEPDDLFIILANSYRTCDSGGLPTIPRSDIVHTTEDNLTAIISDYLIQRRTIDIPNIPHFTLRADVGASAVFVSAPAAASGQLPQGVTYTGENDEGFAQFRLTF